MCSEVKLFEKHLSHSLSSKSIDSHTNMHGLKFYILRTLTSLKAHNDAIWKAKLNSKQIKIMSRWTLPVKSSGRDKCLVKKSVTSNCLTNNGVSTLPQWLSTKNRKIIRQI